MGKTSGYNSGKLLTTAVSWWRVA